MLCHFLAAHQKREWEKQPWCIGKDHQCNLFKLRHLLLSKWDRGRGFIPVLIWDSVQWFSIGKWLNRTWCELGYIFEFCVPLLFSRGACERLQECAALIQFRGNNETKVSLSIDVLTREKNHLAYRGGNRQLKWWWWYAIQNWCSY